ncbi:hypothetical protein JOB18_026063 [Solea senegalensis]|uniref:Uncharacterized protein n=1 Tax=Solea senegalensis TaxID=28829 RepID=A0AAV6SSR0_SOLSE|nr:hypothetical protein JOB18_026063 [Solea senegalensis]
MENNTSQGQLNLPPHSRPDRTSPTAESGPLQAPSRRPFSVSPTCVPRFFSDSNHCQGPDGKALWSPTATITASASTPLLYVHTERRAPRRPW